MVVVVGKLAIRSVRIVLRCGVVVVDVYSEAFSFQHGLPDVESQLCYRNVFGDHFFSRNRTLVPMGRLFIDCMWLHVDS